MPSVLAFGTSMNSQSINRKLAAYAASLVPEAVVTVASPADFVAPLYSQDTERADGVPSGAHDFLAAIAQADALVLSFAEHNGSYTAAFKSLFDWASRVEREVFQGKPILLLSTSPGGRGGLTVLTQAQGMLPRFGGVVVGSLSIPRAGQNLDPESGKVVDEVLHSQLTELVSALLGVISAGA